MTEFTSDSAAIPAGVIVEVVGKIPQVTLLAVFGGNGVGCWWGKEAAELIRGNTGWDGWRDRRARCCCGIGEPNRTRMTWPGRAKVTASRIALGDQCLRRGQSHIGHLGLQPPSYASCGCVVPPRAVSDVRYCIQLVLHLHRCGSTESG